MGSKGILEAQVQQQLPCTLQHSFTCTAFTLSSQPWLGFGHGSLMALTCEGSDRGRQGYGDQASSPDKHCLHSHFGVEGGAGICPMDGLCQGSGKQKSWAARATLGLGVSGVWAWGQAGLLTEWLVFWANPGVPDGWHQGVSECQAVRTSLVHAPALLEGRDPCGTAVYPNSWDRRGAEKMSRSRNLLESSHRPV